jgi:hypothetical protein
MNIPAPVPPPLPWDLDRLPAEALEGAYRQLDAFVGWLRECGCTVPDCWYAHRHLVHRLAALVWWRAVSYQPSATDPATGATTPGAGPKDAAEWWASTWGVAGWLRSFGDLPCKGRPAGHRDQPLPSLDDAVAAHVLAAATGAPR